MSLSVWEQFIITAALSFLGILQPKITNEVEKDALLAAQAFLQKLLSGTVASS